MKRDVVFKGRITTNKSRDVLSECKGKSRRAAGVQKDLFSQIEMHQWPEK